MAGCFDNIRGPQGDGSYVFYAYATDNAGAGFTFTPDASHKWVQWITVVSSTGVPVAPTAADFTGIWIKYIGDDGAPGLPGIDGASEGIDMVFKTGFATPAAGQVTFDASDLSLASQIKISNTSKTAVNISTFNAILGASTTASKALIKFVKKGVPANIAVYVITSAPTFGIGYTVYNVTYLAAQSSAPFADLNDIYMSASLSGNKGNDGADGAPGVVVIENDISQTKTSTVTGAPDPITFTIPAGTLLNNGDICETDINVLQGIDWFGGDSQSLLLFDNNDPGSTFFLAPKPTFGNFIIRFTVSRISATTYWATQEMIDYSGVATFMWGVKFTGGGFNFTTNAYVMTASFTNTVVSGAVAPFATITRATTKYFPKP